MDCYNNLTLKTIFLLKWVNRNCANNKGLPPIPIFKPTINNYNLILVKYVMKSDDDTFVNVPNLLHVLLGGTLPIYNDTYFFHDDVSVNVLSPKNRIVKSKYLLLGCKFCESKPIVDVKSKWFTPNYMYNQKLYPDYLSGSSYLMSFESARRLYIASLSTPLLHLEVPLVSSSIS